MKAAVCAA